MAVRAPQSKCADCGAFTGGWRDKINPNKIICADCYKKTYGEQPMD